MLDADMLGRGVAEDILTAAEVRHGHTIVMIAFEEYDWMRIAFAEYYWMK